MNGRILDLSAIERLKATLGDETSIILPELIEEFSEEANGLIETARQAITTTNASDLRRAAHTLKSNSATFGATTLSEHCRMVEEFAKQEQIGEAAKWIGVLVGDLDEARVALQELKESL